MNTLIAVGAVNSFYLTLLVQAKAQKTLADHVLSLLLLYTGVTFGIVFAALEYGITDLLLLISYTNLSYAPLFYIYVATMVNTDYRAPKRFYLHFIPAVLSVLYVIYLVFSYTEAELNQFFSSSLDVYRPFLFISLEIIELLYLPIYFVVSWKLLNKHKERISNQFSYKKTVSYSWLRLFISAQLLVWFLIDIPLIANYFIGKFSDTQLLSFGSSLSILLVFYLAFYGFRQQRVFSDKVLDEPEVKEAEGTSKIKSGKREQRYSHSGLDPSDIEIFKKKLKTIMLEEKPYLNNLLSIRDLAELIDLSEHNISQVINMGLNKSFYDFVNGFRVEEFKQRSLDKKYSNLTLLAIALDCGFNSKSTFNRIFKQQTGKTPSAWVKSNR